MVLDFRAGGLPAPTSQLYLLRFILFDRPDPDLLAGAQPHPLLSKVVGPASL